MPTSHLSPARWQATGQEENASQGERGDLADSQESHTLVPLGRGLDREAESPHTLGQRPRKGGTWPRWGQYSIPGKLMRERWQPATPNPKGHMETGLRDARQSHRYRSRRGAQTGGRGTGRVRSRGHPWRPTRSGDVETRGCTGPGSAQSPGLISTG